MPSQCTHVPVWPAFVRREEENPFSPAPAGRNNHPSLVPNSSSAGQVRHADDQPADQLLGPVDGLMPAKTLRRLAAETERQVQELLRPRHVLGRHDPGDPEIDLGELVEADLFDQRLAPQRPVAVLR